MANSISFSGLGSGLDTSKIVDQLVAAEKAPVNALNTRKTENTKRISIVGELITKLQALKTSAKALDSSAGISSLSSSTSDATRVKITTASGATPGTYNVKVDKLAQAETSRSRTFTTRDTGEAGNGELTLTVGGTTQTINYDGSDSLDVIAAKINQPDSKVQAAVLFDGTSYRLNVTSKETGVANGISFGGTGDLLGFDDVNAEVVNAQNAQINLNGTTLTRPTNSLTDVVSGVTFDLLSETPVGSSATKLEVTRDAAGLRGKVQALVDAFNSVAKAVGAQTSYSGDGKTQKGRDSLFGDPTALSLQRDLGGLIASEYAHGAGNTSTGQLGIAIARDGTLTLDATKFDAAVAQDPQAIFSLLTGTNQNGLSAAMGKLVDRYTSSNDGLLVLKQKSLNNLTSSYDKQIEKLTASAESLGARLRKQFTAMENIMAKLNSQTSYLDKIFSTKSDN